MAFTVESMESPNIAARDGTPNQFDLPVKEYIAYDPKGKTDITGQPIVREEKEIPTQATTVETVSTEGEPAESVKLSPKITALARKEAAQRQREQALKVREQGFADKLAKAEKYEKLEAKIKAKDYSAADELGLNYEEYTNYLLTKQAGENPGEQRFRKQDEEIAALKRAQEEQVNKDYSHNQSLWKQEIAKVVDSNEAFSTIKELGMHEHVLQLINDSFDEDNIELTVEQAAKHVEEALVERAEKFASVTKVKNRFQDTGKVLGPPKTSGKTITQNMTVTSTQTKPKPFHLLSESEQIQEAYRRVQAAKLQR